MTNYQFPMRGRLEPRSPFKGGRITETDVLDLTEAAKFASVHAGAEITPADFLRAAGRGEITLRAIVHQTAKLERVGGGVYCNAGQPNENTAPKRSILNLPLSACSQLAATGRASWRTFDGFETVDGILMRYTVAELLPDEPDFETVIDDCRVTGNAVNALADAFIDEPAPATDTAPAQAAKPDITLMATRKQLIDAFGAFTGMDIQWFNTIKDTPALLAARKVTGQGGRGHIAEPLFCPFEVLQWLIDTARRKGRPLGPAKGWELFEGHFPRAYAAFSVGDPRTD